jgi:hypothetical protein
VNPAYIKMIVQAAFYPRATAPRALREAAPGATRSTVNAQDRRSRPTSSRSEASVAFHRATPLLTARLPLGTTSSSVSGWETPDHTLTRGCRFLNLYR